ncbi:molybdopterin-guanine dinucleotide biosynthesis protein B [Methanothrix sp.]|uniref:molybdopterin-guanine dinucleotide biosynthesis protein B n=1 Tax=Methanothrix sp. TaxID=90426 RepID=UPI003C735CE8
MKAIAVVGTKKTGKTTLVEALVRSLAEHGRVGTVKSMLHHSVDRGDTKRHYDAGADVVIGLGDARLVIRRERGDLESALAELEREGMDYAVVEGFKNSSLPKIVMGDIEVPKMLRRVRLSEVDGALIEELTEMIRGLEEYSTSVAGRG